MVHLNGILLVALASFLQGHSLTPEAPPPIKLQYTITTTSNQYNGTDLQTPLYVTKLLTVMWSDQTPKLAEVTHALPLKTYSIPDVAKTNMDGSGFRLVYAQNISDYLSVGPKHPVDVITFQELQMWTSQ